MSLVLVGARWARWSTSDRLRSIPGCTPPELSIWPHEPMQSQWGAVGCAEGKSLRVARVG